MGRLSGYLKSITSFARALVIASGTTIAATVLLGVNAPTAATSPCPDVEVVFARGSGEPAGLGSVGKPFVEALRSQLGGRSLGVYPVNYQASTDFDSSDFPQTVIAGIRDAGAHIQSMAANCPSTREVLGGYSQGAAVAGYVTSAVIPAGVSAAAVPAPLAPEIANHVAAVALFGTPSDRLIAPYGGPPIVIGPLYQSKTIRLCAKGDGVCDTGGSLVAHAQYPVNGMTHQAADFASSRL